MGNFSTMLPLANLRIAKTRFPQSWLFLIRISRGGVNSAGNVVMGSCSTLTKRLMFHVCLYD